MKTFSSLLKQYRSDERGATAIEYGLLVALIGVAIVAGAASLGQTLNEGFVTVEEQFPD